MNVVLEREEDEEDEEYESQRRELTRLLGTAKDEDRQEFIRKAITALNDANTGTSPGKKSITTRVNSLYHNQVKFRTHYSNIEYDT